jgi:hypothetical protein
MTAWGRGCKANHGRHIASAKGKRCQETVSGEETVSETVQVPFLFPPGFRCCYWGGGSTLPRAWSVASSSSAVSSSVKSRIFFWRADWGIARISGVQGVNNRSWVFSERLAHGYLSVRQRTGLRTRRLPGLAADGFPSSPRAHANQQPDAKTVTSDEWRVTSREHEPRVPFPVLGPLAVPPTLPRLVYRRKCGGG